MKRYIHAANQHTSLLSRIDKLDLIVIANDARNLTIHNLPIAASSSDYAKDFDQFTPEEFFDVDTKDLRNIDSPIALESLCEAINDLGLDYRMTAKQNQILQEFFKDESNSSVYLSKSDFDKLLKMISECKSVTGPDYRPGQPEKNFAELHNLEMVSADYLATIKQLTYSDFRKAIKSATIGRLGVLLYEFETTSKGYVLKYSKQRIPDDIKIYIKIIPHYAVKYNIAIISFHDPQPETLSDLGDG